MQEALEKVEELNIKAEEEYNIEKAKLVRQKTLIIEEDLIKRKKDFIRKRKAKKSIKTTNTILSFLEKKRNLLKEVFDETLEKIKKRIEEDSFFYRKMLKNFIIEGICLLSGNSFFILCLERDVSIVKEVLCEVKNQFEDLSIEINNTSIAPNSIGGVVVMNEEKNSWCSNTIAERIRISQVELLPSLNKILF